MQTLTKAGEPAREELDDPIELELQLKAFWRGLRRLVSIGCMIYVAVASWMLWGPPSW